MACKIEHKKYKGVESPLGEQLTNIFKSLDRAKEEYAKISSSDFIEQFGDWINDDINERTNDIGEPLLIEKISENKAKNYYFLDRNFDPIDLIVEEFSSFESENLTNEISEVTNQIASYIFKKYIKENFNDITSISKINVSSEITKFTNEKIKEYQDIINVVEDQEDIELAEDAINYIKLIEIHNDEFTTEVINFFNSRQLKIDTDIQEDDLQISQEDGLQGGDIIQSFERNAKDNATANVKLLLSFLPSYQYDIDTQSFEKIYGNGLGEEVFTPMDVVHKELLESLANIVTLNKGGTVTDMYEQMVGVISDLSTKKYHYKDLLALMDSMDENKQNEFVNAFSNAKVNFYTSIKGGTKEYSTYKIFNSSVQKNKATALINEWGLNFKKEFVPKGTKKFNVDKLNKVSRKFKEGLVSLNKNRKGLNFNTITDEEFITRFSSTIDSLIEGFELLGVTNLSEQGFNLFINRFGQDITGNEYAVMFNKLQGTLTKSQDMISDLVDNPRNIKKNPFKEYKSAIFKSLSESEAFYSEDAAENTIVSGGKMYWTFSKPSFISNTINKFKKDASTIKQLTKLTINNNSQWAKHLLGEDTTKSGDYLYDENTRNNISSTRLENLELTNFNSFEEDGDSINSDDNKNISYIDQLVDELNKVLRGGIRNKDGKSTGVSSIYSTTQAADKSTRHEIQIDYFLNDTVSSIGKNKIEFSDEVLNVFTDYFVDEYNRMKQAYKELETLPQEQHRVHYHSKKGRITDGDGFLIGNAFQSQLFPELSPTKEFSRSEFNKKHQLYDVADGTPLFLESNKLTNSQRFAIKSMINDILYQRVKTNTDEFLSTKLAVKKFSNENGRFDGYNIRGLDNSIKNNYKETYETNLDGNQFVNLVSDYTINSLIANVEYTKLFTGDPAYYKNMVDFFKRVPATYTDGINLRLGVTEKDSTFNIATIQNQNVSSKYLDQIEKSLDKTDITEADKKYVLKAYENVNQTDAQAWITPQRWAFLVSRTGKWNDVYQSVYNKMMEKDSSPITEQEMKYVAQPLKGVYFGVVNGVPTYLKYSQAVIFPQLVKGSQLKNLYDGMINGGIDEAITLDGIKVGSTSEDIITDDNGNILEGIKLNAVTLNNAEWKLQQDLPTKLIKSTLLGSQIQKNIYNSINIDSDAVYTLNNGETYSSQGILDAVNDTMSALSNKAIDQLSLDLGKDESGRIDNDRFYAILEREMIEKDYPINMVKSIQKNLPIDSIPGIKDQMYNMFFSKVRTAAVKLKTQGGSFIQMSNFGLDKTTADEKGIKWLVEESELKPPIIEKDLDGNEVVKPGQIFISHSQIAKHIPGYQKMSISEINEKVDDRLLRAVGYRIPNQGMSSNDPLQIVGILPPSMGDTIVAYTEIPTKTGSDFDIDKMYVMLPSSEVVNGKLSYVDFKEGYDQNKNQLENKLFELYWSILTNTNTYADLITPIDFPHVMNGIKRLHGDNSVQTGENLKFYDPLYQLKLKQKYIGGKAGVGITANMLVDHVRSKNIGMKFNDYYLGVGNKNENGETIFDSEYSQTVGGTKYKISHTISAFLNAFVDNAKDPYIDDGNYNSYTSGPTFMLIRAGVHPDWINAFIGQPVLKELVEFTNIYESKSLPKEKEWMSSYDVIYQEYINKFNELSGTKYTKLNGDASDFSKANLEYIIANSGDKNIEFYETQVKVLEVFKEFQKQSKKLSESVDLSRFDTIGAGKDHIDGLIYNNRVIELLSKSNNSEEINNHIKKYVNNGKLTSLGTQLINTLEYTREVLHANPNLFLLASENVNDLYNSISTNLAYPFGGSRGLIKDRELAKTLNNELYSYIMSDFSKFKIDGSPTEYINNTIDAILEFKESERDLDPSDKNAFIENLEFFDGSFGIFSKNLTKDYKNTLYRSFRDIYDNNPELADMIITSSYAQNGFNRSIIDFREFIPHEWFIRNDIRGFFKQKSKEINSGELSVDTFTRQLMKVNSDNNVFVPTITKRTYRSLNQKGKKINIDSGFTLDTLDDESGYKSYIIGETVDGKDLFVDYVKTDDGRLYELQGYKYEAPVYKRINKLGYINKKSFLKIKEYDYNNSSESSYKMNNVFKGDSNIDSYINSDNFIDKSLLTPKNPIQEKYRKDLKNILLSEINVVSSQEENFTDKDNNTDCIF